MKTPMPMLMLTALMVLLAAPVVRADGAAAPQAPAKVSAETSAKKSVEPSDEASDEEAVEERSEASRAEACLAKTRAMCARLERCDPASDVLACVTLTSVCTKIMGPAPSSPEVLARCVRSLAKRACEERPADPSNPASLDPLNRVPACRVLIGAERASSGNQTKPQPASIPAADIDTGGALQ